MSVSEASSKRGNHFAKKIQEKFLVFAGDCDLVNEYLHEKSDNSAFILLQYVNSLLRSFGYVIFANNPISGFIILVSVLCANSIAGLAAILCSTLSFLFALILKQDSLGNLNGFFGYNAILLGTYSAGLLPELYPGISVDEPKFWLFLIFTTFVSVYVTSALANLFRYLGQHPIPCFLLPFNILQYILLFCLLNNSMPATILSRHLLTAPTRIGDALTTAVVSTTESLIPMAATPNGGDVIGVPGLSRRRRNEIEEGFNQTSFLVPVIELEGNYTMEDNNTRWKWGEVFSGTIVSVSQIYGLNYIPGSTFMILAMMIYSPITTLFCYTGSVLGTLIGTTFAANHQEVYSGLWGYNGFLCGGALAGFGFVLTGQSILLTFTAIIFSTILQHYLTTVFLTFDVPMFTIPFNLTAILFLFVTSDSEKCLARPANFTFPERHRYEFKQQLMGVKEGYLKKSRVSETYISNDEV